MEEPKRTDARGEETLFFTKLHNDVLHLIYREILGYDDHVLCFGFESDKVHPQLPMQCWRGDRRLTYRDHEAKEYDAVNKRFPVRKERNLNLLPLLLVCRRLYSDIISLIFSQFTFRFKDARCVLRLSSMVPQDRFQSIRSVQLDFLTQLWLLTQPANRFNVPVLGSNEQWDEACTIIKEQMPRLRLLEIKLTKGNHKLLSDLVLARPFFTMAGSLDTFNIYVDFTLRDNYERERDLCVKLPSSVKAYCCRRHRVDIPCDCSVAKAPSYRDLQLIRNKLKRAFIWRKRPPSAADMPTMSTTLALVETSVDELDQHLIFETGIDRALRDIAKLDYIPLEDEYQFRRRCGEILTAWNDVNKLGYSFYRGF